MSLIFVAPPRSTALTTLARVKAALGVVGTQIDQSLQADIDDASSLIAEECGRQFGEAVVREGFAGDDTTALVLKHRPVSAIEEVTVTADLVEAEILDDCVLQDGPAGILFREDGFWRRPAMVDGITRDPGPMRSKEMFSIRYRGGWRLRSDDVPASGLTVAGAARTITLTARDDRAPWPLLASGERIRLRGFAEDDNAGYKTVISRTDLVIRVAEPLADETAGAGSLIETMTAPAALERLCLEAVRTWYLERKRSLNVTSERIGDWAATYNAADVAHVLPATVLKDVVRLFGLWV